MKLQHYADDPLERFSQDAIDSTLRLSCDDLRYYDYMLWESVITSIRDNAPLISLGKELKNNLLNCNDTQLKRLCSGAVATFAFRNIDRLGDTPVTKGIFRMYIQQHKYTAARYGSEYATQVYGITHEESQRLSGASLFLDSFNTKRYKLVLRCSERTLNELIKLEDDVEKEQNLRFRKNMEVLSETKTTEPNIKTRNTVVAYDPETDEGRANIDTSKKLLARRMFIQGFTTHAVSVELGLTPRQCRHVAEHARAAKYLDSIPSSSSSAGGVLKPLAPAGKGVKSSKTVKLLLRCNETIINASLFMRIYISLGGEDTKESTQVALISLAYGLYCAVRHDVYGLAERSGEKRLTIQDGWILAVDYRSRRSYMTHCNKCGADAFRSTIQRHDGTQCPHC